MVLSKFSRRIVAGIAGLFLLLCQSAGIAHACTTPDPQRSSLSTAHESCHESAPEGGKIADDVCQPHCGSQQASTAPAKVSVAAAADLPVFMARIEQPAFTVHCASPADYLLARAEPPPLTIIHCRLRN